MSKRLKIQRTYIARDRLKEIYVYSYERWGERVATKYLMDIETVIQQAAMDCGGVKRNPQFSKTYTYSPVRQHNVFFDVRGDILYVVTVFHAAMDIKARMEEEATRIREEIGA